MRASTRSQPDAAVVDQPLVAPRPSGFTLIEMLVAMAITLVMVAAVVTLFANISNSVRSRRATIEMNGQLRHARNVLQRDLQGATCPGLTWRRPEENQGYIELVEGPYREGNASALIDNNSNNGEIDHTTSIIPASNLPFTSITGQERWATDGGGLGDADDILMFTARNEREPYVGNMPTNVRSESDIVANANLFGNWQSQAVESPLAEVVWYAVENPAEIENPSRFFGEAGMRTIYRRALLIAPFINPYHYSGTVLPGSDPDVFKEPAANGGKTFHAEPGLVRILRANITKFDFPEALACLIAFQERYDLSVRIEFDPLLDAANGGRWKIVANTLGDLTKRENRYEHHFFSAKPPGNPAPAPSRIFPFGVVSSGSGYNSGSSPVTMIRDRELDSTSNNATATATIDTTVPSKPVLLYGVNQQGDYIARPFAYVGDGSATPATARVMLNDERQVVRVIPGLVPLSGLRRGEDVMLSDALAFDLRVYDPGAPLYEDLATETTLEPSDIGWSYKYSREVKNDGDPLGVISETDPTVPNSTSFVGQGVYVDMGYAFGLKTFGIASGSSVITPWFAYPRAVSDVYLISRLPVDNWRSQLAPGYAVYDTWSFHYENDGLNENKYRLDTSGTWQQVNDLTDEGTNGLDDVGSYSDTFVKGPTNPRLGPDDVGERETAPPYDKPLRGVQVVLRLYERDSRQIRQVSVNQHFVPE